MPDEKDDEKGDTIPQAKRTGRDAPDPAPEFTDEMRTNRFTEPPEPGEKK
jgi:hypothetical protein